MAHTYPPRQTWLQAQGRVTPSRRGSRSGQLGGGMAKRCGKVLWAAAPGEVSGCTENCQAALTPDGRWKNAHKNCGASSISQGRGVRWSYAGRGVSKKQRGPMCNRPRSWEPGLSRIDEMTLPDCHDSIHVHCQLAVVGCHSWALPCYPLLARCLDPPPPIPTWDTIAPTSAFCILAPAFQEHDAPKQATACI